MSRLRKNYPRRAYELCRCAVDDATKNMLDAARIGRQTANGPEAQLKRANTQRKNALAQHAWKSSDQPAWLTDKFYSEKVQPLLAGDVGIRNRATNFGFALVRRTHPRGLPPASEALGGAGEISGSLATIHRAIHIAQVIMGQDR